MEYVYQTMGYFRGFNKSRFYRLSRKLHIYLSAMAFLLLIFFAVSGLLLNHPDWFDARRVKNDIEMTLPPALFKQALSSDAPEQALAGLVKKQRNLPGELYDHQYLGDGYQLEYRGLGGSTSVFVDEVTGNVEGTVRRAGLAEKLHNLHKGKNTGTTWSAIIDLSAYLILALSLFGFFILFTVKLRLENSLKILAGSVLALLIILTCFTP